MNKKLIKGILSTATAASLWSLTIEHVEHSPIKIDHSLEEPQEIESANRIHYQQHPPVRIFEMRTGPAPDAYTDEDSGTLLATFSTADFPFNPNGTTATCECLESGTAGHLKIKENGQVVYVGIITQTGDGGDLQFDNTTCVQGGTAILQYRL
jgi:hypothetical protein